MTMQEENKLLKEHLWAVCTAQGRMLDKWADGDEKVQTDTWRELHSAGNQARDFLDSIGSKIHKH